MAYHSSIEVFPSDVLGVQEKMLRLRQQIIEAQQYRRKLDTTHPTQNGVSRPKERDSLDRSYWSVEKQITDLRIWEMETRLTALLDIQGD